MSASPSEERRIRPFLLLRRASPTWPRWEQWLTDHGHSVSADRERQVDDRDDLVLRVPGEPTVADVTEGCLPWRTERGISAGICTQASATTATFKSHFKHICTHRLELKRPDERSQNHLESDAAGSSPQMLCTGFPAFRAGSPQSYPQALLQRPEPLSSVGCGPRGIGGRRVDADACRWFVFCSPDGRGMLRHPISPV